MITRDTRQTSATRTVRRTRLLPRWALLLGAFLVALIGTFPYYGGTDSYVLLLLGKFLTFAIFALSIDLIWGFAGILSLGQAVYFGMGAYFVALSLKINYAFQNPTRYGNPLPDFMEWNGLTEVPRFMLPLTNTAFAVFCAVAIPTLIHGWFLGWQDFLYATITYRLTMQSSATVGIAQHIQALASLFYADSANDVAPGAYNAPEPAPGLPRSPLPPPSRPAGFSWESAG